MIPGDHPPRHVHARRGTGNAPEAVFLLNADGTLLLREADRDLTRSELRNAAHLVEEHFVELAQLWEDYC